MLLPLFIPIPLVILLNSVNVMHCCTVRQACGSQQCSLHQCRCRTKGVWRELQMFQQRCQQFQLMLQCGNMSVFQMMFNFYIQRQPHHTCYQVHCHSLHMHFHQVLCNSLHWIVLQQKADRPQTPRELKIPLRPNLDLVSFGRAMQKRVTQWLLAQNEDMPDPVPKKKSPPEKLMQAWRRMVLATIRLYLEVMLQSVTDYLTSRNRGTMAKLPKAKKDKSLVPAESKKTAKVRRGIGQPLPRSKACKSWPKEPLDCAHEESQLRQRGSKDSFWWTCLQCGSRWQRVEWEPDMELNAGAASSGEYRGSAGTEKIQTSSKVAYPSRLPPPRSRPNLTTLVVEEETVVRTDPLMAHEGRMTPAPMQSEGQLPMPLEHPQNRHRQAAMGIPPTTSLVTDMAAQALMDGMDFDPTDQTADQQLEKLMAEHKKERRKQMQMASGVRPAQPRSKSRGPASSELEIQEIHTSDDETTPRKAIQDFQMVTP